MQTIALQDVPTQTLRVLLAGQASRIDVRQRSTGVFVDLYVNDSPIVVGVIARNRVRMVRDAYLGFIGDLAFLDEQGTDDPSTPGLGTRYLLCYLTAEEVPSSDLQ